MALTLTELVKDKTVRFKYYRDAELVYETQDAFEFVVPISDTGSGTFKVEDKAILFMRWIRKQLEQNATWEKERQANVPEVSPGFLGHWEPLTR